MDDKCFLQSSSTSFSPHPLRPNLIPIFQMFRILSQLYWLREKQKNGTSFSKDQKRSEPEENVSFYLFILSTICGCIYCIAASVMCCPLLNVWLHQSYMFRSSSGAHSIKQEMWIHLWWVQMSFIMKWDPTDVVSVRQCRNEKLINSEAQSSFNNYDRQHRRNKSKHRSHNNPSLSVILDFH